MFKKRMIGRWAVALLMLLGAGCGGRSDLPPLGTVHGRVTLDGAPLPRGSVQFVPDASRNTDGPPAVGEIDEAGYYELTTAGAEGAVAGWHKVRIEARALPRDETDTLPASLIPARYGDPDQSGLTFEIQADQDHEIDLSLQSQ